MSEIDTDTAAMVDHVRQAHLQNIAASALSVARHTLKANEAGMAAVAVVQRAMVDELASHVPEAVDEVLADHGDEYFDGFTAAVVAKTLDIAQWCGAW